MNKLSLLVLFTITAASTGTALAHGDVKCEVPKAEWRGQMDLQSKLVNEGWKVRRVQVDNGCFEVYGFDSQGQRVEAWFNPKTFERVMPADEKPAK